MGVFPSFFFSRESCFMGKCIFFSIAKVFVAKFGGKCHSRKFMPFISRYFLLAKLSAHETFCPKSKPVTREKTAESCKRNRFLVFNVVLRCSYQFISFLSGFKMNSFLLQDSTFWIQGEKPKDTGSGVRKNLIFMSREK